jgi:tetratricopeptide (TPR) repeat protein
MNPHFRLAYVLLVATSLLAPAGGAGAVEPVEAERTEQTHRDRLFDQLKKARTEAEGRAIEHAIWEMWMAEAPTPEIARTVKQAMDARESYDYERALKLLDGVVAAAPTYAEAWNQRAFIRFLREDFDGALEDVEQALKLEPRHFAALSGRALVLMRQGRMEAGQKALREAVEIHPWLKERSMLIPEPGGKDI